MKKQTNKKDKIIIIIFHQVLGKEHFSFSKNKNSELVFHQKKNKKLRHSFE